MSNSVFECGSQARSASVERGGASAIRVPGRFGAFDGTLQPRDLLDALRRKLLVRQAQRSKPDALFRSGHELQAGLVEDRLDCSQLDVTCGQEANVLGQARQLSWTLAERPEPMRFLIRDRDQKFTDRFDDVLRSEGLKSFGRRFARHKPTASPSDSCAPSAQNVATGC